MWGPYLGIRWNLKNPTTHSITSPTIPILLKSDSGSMFKSQKYILWNFRKFLHFSWNINNLTPKMKINLWNIITRESRTITPSFLVNFASVNRSNWAWKSKNGRKLGLLRYTLSRIYVVLFTVTVHACYCSQCCEKMQQLFFKSKSIR